MQTLEKVEKFLLLPRLNGMSVTCGIEALGWIWYIGLAERRYEVEGEPETFLGVREAEIIAI